MISLIGQVVLGTLLFNLSMSAYAHNSRTFAKCYGEHHGSYLSLIALTNQNAVSDVVIERSGDSDFPAVAYVIENITKNGQSLMVSAYSWAIRQAIKAAARGDFYGFLMVEAVSTSGSKMYLNLNRWTGDLEHALVIDGYVEPLTCPVDLITE